MTTEEAKAYANGLDKADWMCYYVGVSKDTWTGNTRPYNLLLSPQGRLGIPFPGDLALYRGCTEIR